jgi:ATP synthase subunit 6
LFDPLEQFNIVITFCWRPCCPRCPLPLFSMADNISQTSLITGVFFVVIPMICLYKFNSYYFYFFKFLILEVLNIITSNLLLKKQIFVSLFYTMFFLITFSNAFGLVPYSITSTSFFLVSFFLSSVAFLSCVIVGIYKGGIGFFNNFLPSGVPYAIGLGLVLIELISYSSRLLSLSIRLFANMMSGHTLIKILLGFTWLIVLFCSVYVIFFSAVTLLIITYLEFIIAFLQGYIFIVLISIYFNGSVHTH